MKGNVQEFTHIQNSFQTEEGALKIGKMEERYGDDIKEYLKKKFKDGGTEELLALAEAYKDFKDLSYYVLYMMEMTDNIISDDKAQLALLKNTLDKNTEAPEFEIFDGSIEVDYLFKGRKNKEVYRTDVTEMPTEKGLYKIKYRYEGREKYIFMRYRGRNKVTFHSDESNDRRSNLGMGDIKIKNKEVERGRFQRNGEYYKEKYIENSLIQFKIKGIKLKLNFKFYDYN